MAAIETKPHTQQTSSHINNNQFFFNLISRKNKRTEYYIVQANFLKDFNVTKLLFDISKTGSSYI